MSFNWKLFFEKFFYVVVILADWPIDGRRVCQSISKNYNTRI